MSIPASRVGPRSPGQEGAEEGERRAWAGDSPLVAAARGRLVEATARCIGRDGLAATSVAGIALEAGVSRQTVYRYFSSRDELVGLALLWAADGVRTKIEAHIRELSDPADMIVDSVVLGVAELRENSVLRGVSGTLGLDGFVSTRITEPRGTAWAREALAIAIQAAGWSGEEAESSIEFILRIFLSLIASPSPRRTPEELRAYLYRHLIPGLGLAEADPGSA